MVNLEGWGFGSDRTVSIGICAERRFLAQLDDVPVVLQALRPYPSLS